METYNNPILERLPLHLRQYVVPQHYARYSPIDQAVWRYVMRQNYAYLKDVAYYPYIPGLRKAGLTIERIPDLQAMNDSLKQIGWGAVTVDGFIPPAAFMEFQAHEVLVIAADIRQLEHIEYTPAPDIIHESSGHAPIIGEPEYAAYLQYFGEIGTKAMFSAQDFELYEAIRNLSIIKEKHHATAEEITLAENLLKNIQENMGEPSEMALLSRLHWWTVEYGLIGTLEDPKIYGAGLLSSIGESASCMRAEVPKLPYNLEALEYTYDITKPQPQLFVTPDFVHLRNVLDDFADTMAFRVGGKISVDKAIACRNVCTIVYSSGLQVSGIFKAPMHVAEDLRYIQTTGPTALSYQNVQLEGHGKTYHQDGFGSPVGALQNGQKALEDYTEEELQQHIDDTGEALFTFESGIEVRGKIQATLSAGDKLLLITLTDCQAMDLSTGQILFDPAWGVYDMAVGQDIISVYAGAADKTAFEHRAEVSTHQTQHAVYDGSMLRLHRYYQDIRDIREGRKTESKLPEVFRSLQKEFPREWLALLEILEILAKADDLGDLAVAIEAELDAIAHREATLKKLIEDGIRLAKDKSIAVLLTQ